MRGRFLCILLVFLIGFTTVKSQSFNFIRTSNFDGLNNIMLNPASSINNKIYLDINIASASLYLKNDILYIPKEDFNFATYLFDFNNIPMYEAPFENSKGRPFLNKEINENPVGLARGIILGPSVHLSLKDRSFSFYTASRIEAQGQIPSDLSNFVLNGTHYRSIYGSNILYPDFDSGVLAWNELGFSFARMLNANNIDNISLGANLKILSGQFAAFYLNRESHYSITDDALLSVYDVNMTYAYTEKYHPLAPKGYGMGIDLGFQYVKRGNHRATSYYTDLKNQSYDEYNYKLGVSLTDLGSIHFNKNAVYSHLASDTSFSIADFDDFEFTSIDSINQLLYNKVYGENSNQSSASSFNYSLPPKISAQIDIHLKKNWYLNVIYQTGIPFPGAHMTIPGQLSICPRYESRKLEMWFPITYNRLNLLQFGFAIRAGIFIIGTENLWTWARQDDFTGMDIFFGMTLPFTKEDLKQKQ